LPVLARPVSDRRITAGRMAIVATVCAWFAYMVITVIEQFVEGRASSARLGVEAIVYLFVVTALTASAMAYLITRIGFFYRSRAHQRAPRAAIDQFFGVAVPTVTVLVPSYQEDARVIRTTLLSAALQEHPYLRVVLLIDDPVQPKTRSARELLAAARALPGEIEAELNVPLAHVRSALERFEALQVDDRRSSADDMRELAGHYEYATNWLRELGERHDVVDHADVFFVDHVVGALARDLEAIAAALHAGADEGACLDSDRVLELYRRLVSTFRAELSSFERKQYVSCSHAANKAMNLNSYIALMGGSYQEVSTPIGPALVRCSPRDADLTVPEPDYVLTLDADSVLLPEYCARILYLMEQGGNSKIGVAQTPYSSYPGSATRIERISGATTDIQHLVHQGMTHYDATFWVGANAILRKRALDDIVEVYYENNWEIRRYIQDRTVIEDTESTIDLGIHGWSLMNYPERLAYSSTPPDFGSLCIQRQRWANGGLLILSKLRRQSAARRERGDRNRFGELFLRVNYMASIFWASLCLLILLIYPFNSGLLKPMLPLIALPYFLMMASDMRYCGYKRLDVFRIYGFNLILLPVNLSGTFASMLQLVTGETSSFKRTPKVRNRTATHAGYLLAPLALIAFSLYWVRLDLQTGQYNHLFFAALNAGLALYAMVAFVGVGNTIVDLWVQLRSWLYRPVVAPVPVPAPVAAAAITPTAATPVGAAPTAARIASVGPIGDWASVLHYGTTGSAGRVVARRLPDGVRTAHHATPTTSPASDRTQQSPGGPPTDAGTDAPSSSAFQEYTFFTVFQPVVDLASGAPVGYEALTRFADGQSPQASLAAALAAGVGLELDVALAHAALASATALPSGVWLSINVSSALASDTAALRALVSKSRCPLVLDLGDGSTLDGAIPQLPGVMFSIDDAGAGYDSLSRIERLRPSFLRLHRQAVAGIEGDAALRMSVTALVQFADEHQCQVIGEGIESEAELDALRAAGVHLGQGYFTGRPVPIGRMTEPVTA
jgi:EAL domain-containing protein (putative c-di-GMP-specific phosphodiesterase class I)/cellulose synthase/poly-beta-1,6-N-acetylglucosamine synthase-like glycosyltransferase